MTTLKASAVARVWGTRNAWSLTPPKGSAGAGVQCNVAVQIESDKRSGGCHLIMAPEGFFTADCFYETIDEAKADALELFGIKASDWS